MGGSEKKLKVFGKIWFSARDTCKKEEKLIMSIWGKEVKYRKIEGGKYNVKIFIFR